VLCASLLLGATTGQADQYREVRPHQLLKNPQNFWSVGVTFHDVLTAYPDGEAVELKDRVFVPFKTETIGICYADQNLVPVIKNLPLGKECLFSGTVFQFPGGLLFGDDKFHVVVHRVKAAFEDVGDIRPGLVRQAKSALDKTGNTVQDMELIEDVHQALFRYAEQQNIDIKTLFVPESIEAQRGRQVVRSATAEYVQETGLNAEALLNDILWALFSHHYGQATPPPAQQAPESVAPAPGPTPEPPAKTESFKPLIPLRSGIKRQLKPDGDDEQNNGAEKPPISLRE
jgi:hypothetical protein